MQLKGKLMSEPRMAPTQAAMNAPPGLRSTRKCSAAQAAAPINAKIQRAPSGTLPVGSGTLHD